MSSKLHVESKRIEDKRQARAFVAHLREGCDRCADDLWAEGAPARRLVEIVRLAGAPARASCLSGNELMDLLFGRLQARRAISIAAHIGHCDVCAAWLDRGQASLDLTARSLIDGALTRFFEQRPASLAMTGVPDGVYRATLSAPLAEAAQSEEVSSQELLNRFELEDVAKKLGCFAFCDVFTDRTVSLTVTETSTRLKSAKICGSPATYEGGQWRAIGRVDETCAIVIEIVPEYGDEVFSTFSSGIDADMKTDHFIASGDVQGVHYRAFLQKVARSLGVRGWVKNLPNGTVEFVAQGPESRLSALRAWAEKGPLNTQIKLDPQVCVGDEVFTDFVVRD